MPRPLRDKAMMGITPANDAPFFEAELPRLAIVPNDLEGANDLFSPERWKMIRGLGVRARLYDRSTIPSQNQGSAISRVYAAAKEYQNPDVPLAEGLSENVLRFLCVSAGILLWEDLAEDDPLIVSMLIENFIEGVSIRGIVEHLKGARGRTQTSSAIRAAVRRLWEAMPPRSETFPLDKEEVFPPADQITRQGGLGAMKLREGWNRQRKERSEAMLNSQTAEVKRRKSLGQYRRWAKTRERKSLQPLEYGESVGR